jgi:hypothetical protein
MRQMPGPYPENDAEILLTRYKEHAEHIRHLDLFEIRVASGFVTVQLIFGSWFVSHPVESCAIKFSLLLIDIALLLVCVQLLLGARNRRGEVVETIRNINSALGLDKTGTYLPDRAINPPNRSPRFPTGTKSAALLIFWVLR